MTTNGVVSTTTATVIYTAPTPTPGIPLSGSPRLINLFRVVNNSTSLVTFNLYLNLTGTPIPFIPIDLELPAGACWDDIPIEGFTIPAGATLCGDANTADVVLWTINVIPKPE